MSHLPTAMSWLKRSRPDAWEFAPDIVRIQQRPPAPLPRFVSLALTVLLMLALVWACFGQLDIVAVAQGKLVPQGFLKIVQPAESGVVREILVKEGDAVASGQVLVRMDTSLSEADGRALEGELQRKRMQLRRIDSELTGMPLKREDGDPPDLHAQTEAQLHARRQAHLDALAAERAALARARHDLMAAIEAEGKLKKTVPIYRDQAEAWNKLASEGFAGRLLALDRQRVYLESEQELKAQAQNVASLKALVTQSETRVAQLVSNYRQQLQNERAETEALLHRLQQDRDKQRHRHALLELKAPQAGIVKDLATHTPGTVVAPGTILLTLVPLDEPLVAEVWVGNMDSGFVRADQKARVKLAAYPFQKYGMLDGIVRQIGADAREGPGSDARAASRQDAAYRALISLEDTRLPGGQALKLVPGMQVNAEIHLGTRTVLEYLLSPVRKAAHEAGRER
jgi:HlyD family secretion protein